MEASARIDEAEAEAQLRYVSLALDAPSTEHRDQALTDALLVYGHRFGYTLRWLADRGDAESPEHAGDNPFRALEKAYGNLLLRWLGGERLTDRLDEPERRRAAAVATAEQAPGLGRLAAKAILALPAGHPRRDVAQARRLLEGYAGGSPDGEAETELYALAQLLDLDAPDEHELAELVARGLDLERRSEDPAARRAFRVAAAGRYIALAHEARDGGERERPTRLSGQGSALLEQLEPDAGILAMLGVLAEAAGDDAAAAARFRQVVDDPGADPDLVSMAAGLESRLRYSLGELDRVVELLTPRLATLEERYLTAVADADVEAAGRALGDAVINLAFAHAHLGRWNDAIVALDRGKSRRLLYRSALRATPEGREILARERELYALGRGAAVRPPARPERAQDVLAQDVTAEAALLESYRRLRPRLEAGVLGCPALGEIAAVLGDDEAVLLLGARSEECIVVGVTRGDTTAPAVARLLPLPMDRWLAAYAADEGFGWLTGLEAGLRGAELGPLLQPVLDLAAELVRDAAGELGRRGVRRVTVVPHRWLHVVPFWATAPLTRFEVQHAASATALVAERRAAAPRVGARGVIVENPTRDLPVARAESEAVERHLRDLGIACERVARDAATEERILAALDARPGLLHFCGHGRSDLVRPERSALLVAPEPELAPGREDPFEAWVAAVERWEDDDDGVRSADLPGLGQLVEEQADGAVERRLEHGERGTLWTRYVDGRRVAVAELWSAGDMLVGQELDGCALAVLSACESGAGALGVDKIDEAAGLPAALQLAGAASVLATLWPVGDALGALFVDAFYAELARRRGPVDLVSVVSATREWLRTLRRDDARDAVEALRRGATDPVARFTLERFGRDLAGRGETPFGDPYDWAPFAVSGAPVIVIEEDAA